MILFLYKIKDFGHPQLTSSELIKSYIVNEPVAVTKPVQTLYFIIIFYLFIIFFKFK